MPSTKPYLVRAVYEWASDNNLTPQILVTDSVDDIKLPKDLVNDGRIVFNIDSKAVTDLHLKNEWVMFSARFSGHVRQIEIPVDAILAIYARENGQGIFFTDENNSPPPAKTTKTNACTLSKELKGSELGQTSHLKLVK